MLGIVPAVVRLDVIDPAQVTAPVDAIEQPGTALDVFAGFGVEPGGMQPVVRSELEGFDPGQQVAAVEPLPAFQVGIADAAVEGVEQMETAVAAAAAVESSVRSHLWYSGTECSL